MVEIYAGSMLEDKVIGIKANCKVGSQVESLQSRLQGRQVARKQEWLEARMVRSKL